MRAPSFALVAAVLTGCAPQVNSYLPTAPLLPTWAMPLTPSPTSSSSSSSSSAEKSARITVAEVLAPGTLAAVAVGLDVETAPGTMLLDARVSATGATPCQGGRPIDVLSVDEQRQWLRPVAIAGRHRLTLELPVDEGAEGEPGQPLEAIDLSIGRLAVPQLPITDGTAPAETAAGTPQPPSRPQSQSQSHLRRSACVRVLLPQGPSALRKRNLRSWGGSVRIDPPVLRGYSAVARMGRWIGPLRVGAEAGVSLRHCGECTSRTYLGLPLALTAELIGTRPSGVGLGLEAAYVARPTFGLAQGDRYLLHGPRVTVRLVSAAPRRSLRPGGPQASYDAFDLWFGRWTTPGVPNWSQTLWGVGWTWDAGF